MDTKIVTIDSNCIDEGSLIAAGNIIKSGGLVAFPTETVYGLGGDALNSEASGKIYAAKGRPSDNPLIVHIAELDDLYTIASSVDKRALILADKYWPGPLTMIFPKKSIVPDATTGYLDTVAVRMPSHPIAKAFIKAAGGFIAAPSANASGRPSPTTCAHVVEDMSGKIEMIIDGVSCDIGLESTIVDFTSDTPMLLRPGYVSHRMLEDLIGPVLKDPAVFGNTLDASVKPKAPGMKYRHYAPKGELAIVRGQGDAVYNYIQAHICEAKSNGKRVGVIVSTDYANKYTDCDFIGDIGNRDNEAEIASNLYDLLRRCDEEHIDVIYSEEFDTPNLGQAIMNRLIKAAGHTIIEV